MILTCNRIEISERGSFAEVLDESGAHFFWTAEHSYRQADGSWAPKVGAATYQCQRGIHQIPTGERFDTFEVLSVPGHVGILFVHPGNLPQVDSDGCFIAGRSLGWLTPKGEKVAQRAVIMSRDVIDTPERKPGIWTVRMRGIDTFTLIVNDPT